MESKFLNTAVGKACAFLVVPSMFIIFLAACYEYSLGKTPWPYGLLVSIIGLSIFLKAKYSVIRKGKLISWGCDLMDQRNTLFYFFGWVLMVGGYFLSFK